MVSLCHSSSAADKQVGRCTLPLSTLLGLGGTHASQPVALGRRDRVA